jgi:hypothetical protein
VAPEKSIASFSGSHFPLIILVIVSVFSIVIVKSRKAKISLDRREHRLIRCEKSRPLFTRGLESKKVRR